MELQRRWELLVPIAVVRFVFTNLVSHVVEFFVASPLRSQMFSFWIWFSMALRMKSVFRTPPHPFSFGKVGLMFIMLLLYWWFCHRFLIKDPIKWEKIPNESKKKNLSREWFTAKEDSIHIKTTSFCFWCVFCRGGAPRQKRATVFASKPNPRRDLIHIRFYIYSDNQDSLMVSNRTSRILFWFEDKASTKCNRLC